MTWALCHGCGCTKFGAIVPCPECELASTGNFDLDVLFSDHHITRRSIDAFGAILKALYAAPGDATPELRHFAFLVHVSDHYPEMGLSIGTKSPDLPEAQKLLATLDLPSVIIEPSRHGPPGSAKGRRRWWEFWKRGP